MIHDKDYLIRMVRQFSEVIARMLLGKNEGKLKEDEMVFETQMKDVFKMNFEDLSSMSTESIIAWVEDKEASHQIPYFELLGNLFYFKYQDDQKIDFAVKAKKFYEIWLRKSQVFSLPVMSRIKELDSL